MGMLAAVLLAVNMLPEPWAGAIVGVASKSSEARLDSPPGVSSFQYCAWKACHACTMLPQAMATPEGPTPGAHCPVVDKSGRQCNPNEAS